MSDSQNSDKLSDASVTRLTSSPPPAGISNGNDAHPDRRISATEPELLNCTLTRENEASTMQSITEPDSNRTPNTPEKTSEKPIDADRNNTRSSVIDFIKNNKSPAIKIALGVTGSVLLVTGLATMMAVLLGVGFMLIFLIFIAHLLLDDPADS